MEVGVGVGWGVEEGARLYIRTVPYAYGQLRLG
jgi:hypothetical protein